MYSSFWFDTMKSVHIYECQVIIFKKYHIILSEDRFTFTYGVEHDAAFYMGIHCLQKISFSGFPNTKT